MTEGAPHTNVLNLQAELRGHRLPPESELNQGFISDKIFGAHNLKNTTFTGITQFATGHLAKCLYM